MQLRRLKYRFRRNFRLRKHQFEGLVVAAEHQLERNFIHRFGSVLKVKRFVAGWIALLLVLCFGVIIQTRALSGYYQTLQPIPGGMFNEGIVGAYTNANPVYASGEVDSAVSRLLFAGLLTYNSKNQLVGDLANRWSVNSTGEVYTVHLRPHLRWQDGAPLTSNDVVFTYHVIQNPDAQSPLNESWQNVTVTAQGPNTVVFTLPNPLSSFPYSLTTGIIPEHILGNVPMDQMRSVAFNTTNPIGAGPFSLESIAVNGNTPQTEEQEVELKPFAGYHGGKPKLESFIIHAFSNQRQMIDSFNSQGINAMVGLTTVPPNLATNASVHQYSMPLTAANMVFFKTSEGILSDTKLRQALILGANTSKIIKSLGFKVKPVNEPLLSGQTAYNPAYQQMQYNPEEAMQTLNADGWEVGAGGVRYKDGVPLTFGLYSADDSQDIRVSQQLASEWRAIGVNVHVYPQDSTNFQATLAFHDYDAVLTSISIGVDPDVFVYWDSSQASVHSPYRLNFSEYQSSAADEALETGRTRSNPALRAVIYKPFLQAWQQDAPALGLYQPRFLYISRGSVYGLADHTINSEADRYDNVQNWMINEAEKTDKS